MLIFGSSKMLEETSNELNVPSKGAKKSFFGMGFRSQKDIFDQIIIEEGLIDDQISLLSETERQKLDPAKAHSALYLEMLSKGVIREYEEDGGMSYDYAMCYPVFASVANEDGFFAVNDTVYYIGAEKMVRWDNADFNSLNKMKDAFQTDSLSNIYVSETRALTKGKPADEVYTEVHYSDGYRASGNKYKYALHLHFQIGKLLKLGSDCMRIDYRYYISVKSKKKKLLGGYNYYNANVVYKATTNASANVYRTSQPSSILQAVPAQSVKEYTGSVGNSIFAVAFYGDSTDPAWAWNSLMSIYFRIGTEKIAVKNTRNEYDFKTRFEGQTDVNMSGNISVTPQSLTPVIVNKIYPR